MGLAVDDGVKVIVTVGAGVGDAVGEDQAAGAAGIIGGGEPPGVDGVGGEDEHDGGLSAIGVPVGGIR